MEDSFINFDRSVYGWWRDRIFIFDV